MRNFPLVPLFEKGVRIILLLSVLLVTFGAGGTQVVHAAPPSHDDFGSAKLITGIEYHDLNVNTTEATPSDTIPNVDDPDNIPCEGDTLNAGFASVWYTYTPPEPQSISLDTFGSRNPFGANMDTFIAVWTGSRGSLNLVACNDDAFEGLVSELSFVASPGQTYYIEVAQFNDGLGSTDVIGGLLNFNAYITNTNIWVGGTLRARYYIPETGGLRRSLSNLNSGPVEIFNVANNQIIAAERVIYRVNGVDTSFSEMMGLPDSQLDDVYWLPWYNNVDLNTQLRFGNVSNANATVHVTIGGVPMAGSPYVLAPGASIRRSYPGVDRGPVRIQSNVPIVAAERVIYNVNGADTSFTEMMAFPESQLDTIYWMPWYNNKDLDTQLRFGNVSNTNATVHVTIGGVPVAGSPYILAPGQSIRRSYPGVDRGPVKIQSNVPIIAAERVIYRVNGIPVSFSEMMGLPNSHLSTTYWFPWYNNRTLGTQIRIGNVSNAPATVRIYIGGQEMAGSPITLPVGQSRRLSYADIDRGPVKVESDVPIVAAERVIYTVNTVPTSFSEMMGLSNALLDERYWMPWYNNVDLNTQLRFALP